MSVKTAQHRHFRLLIPLRVRLVNLGKHVVLEKKEAHPPSRRIASAAHVTLANINRRVNSQEQRALLTINVQQGSMLPLPPVQSIVPVIRVTMENFKHKRIQKQPRAPLGELATLGNTKEPLDLSLQIVSAAHVRLGSFNPRVDIQAHHVQLTLHAQQGSMLPLLPIQSIVPVRRVTMESFKRKQIRK